MPLHLSSILKGYMVPLRATFRQPLRYAAFCLLAHVSALAEPVNVTWNGGIGTWSDAANWTPSVVPNNGVPAGSFYNAIVDGGLAGTSNAVIELGETFSISNLRITPGDLIEVS